MTLQQKMSDFSKTFMSEIVGIVKRRRLQYAFFAAAIASGSLYLVDISHAAIHTTALGATANASAGNGMSSGATSSNLAHNDQATSSKSSTIVQTSLDASGDAAPDLRATVTVNGQDVPVPSNGSAHQDISNASGNTSVDVSHTSSGTGTNSANASVNVQINSQSYSSNTTETNGSP